MNTEKETATATATELDKLTKKSLLEEKVKLILKEKKQQLENEKVDKFLRDTPIDVITIGGREIGLFFNVSLLMDLCRQEKLSFSGVLSNVTMAQNPDFFTKVIKLAANEFKGGSLDDKKLRKLLKNETRFMHIINTVKAGLLTLLQKEEPTNSEDLKESDTQGEA